MTFEPENKYVLINREVFPLSGIMVPDNAQGIYEVVRVIEGIPLFFEDHFARFCSSAKIAGVSLDYEEHELFSLLLELIRKNDISVGNILVSKKIHLVACFIRHSYPTVEMYRQGVDCKLLHAERSNPNAKVLHTHVREKAGKIMDETGCYEVLLVDQNGFVTEGSRSNLFFVSGEKIFTTPGSQVLLGITRQKAIETAKLLNIPVVERKIHSSELQNFDAAFITGTSPKILTVRLIDSVIYDVKNRVVVRLTVGYDQSIKEYIRLHK